VSKKLVVSDGTRERELQLVGTLVVGRDPLCDITYDDALLSRRHAEFVAAGDQVTVRDLGSRNGVFVNGKKIAERSLRSGDVVQIGPVRARYVADLAPVSIAPEEVDAGYTAVLHHDAPAVPSGFRQTSGPPEGGRHIAPEGGHHIQSGDDDDRTRLIPAPRALQTADSAVQQAPVSAPAIGDDDERTQFLRAPMPSAPPPSSVQPRPATVQSVQPPPAPAARPSVAAKPAAAPIAPQSAIRNPQPAIRNPVATFVLVQVLALAAVVLLASAIPLIVWRRAVLSVDQASASAPIVWLALPVAVAVVAAYYVSTLINRRFIHALADVERSRTLRS
jgi:hypothetical protein